MLCMPSVPGHFLRASHRSFNIFPMCLTARGQGPGAGRGGRAGQGPCSHFPTPRGPPVRASLQTGLSSQVYAVRAPQTGSEPQRSRAYPQRRVREDQSTTPVGTSVFGLGPAEPSPLLCFGPLNGTEIIPLGLQGRGDSWGPGEAEELWEARNLQGDPTRVSLPNRPSFHQGRRSVISGALWMARKPERSEHSTPCPPSSKPESFHGPARALV